MAVSVARRDVDLQLVNDRNYGASPNTLRARMAAALEAEQAFSRGEEGAAYAWRQALVDVAAAAELLAENLAAPERSRRHGANTWRAAPG